MTEQITHSPARRAQANGVELVYDTFGDPSAPPMLLVMGLGAQMIVWDEEFCKELAAEGYWVIRFDNRDIGLSTKFTKAGVPNTMALMQGQAVKVPYLLSDMANDAVGLLDALGIEQAHVVGASMGGMIVQMMAIDHPLRLRTLTSIMSTTGNPNLPPANPAVLGALFQPAPSDREGYLQHSLATSRLFAGSGFPFDEERALKRAARAYERGLNPAGTARQLAAVIASGSRKEALKNLTTPTLVIHGDADPLVPLEGGIDTAEAIPDAELLIIEGMGHSLPLETWPQIVGAITRHAAAH
ncbi:MAG: alpha/beta fold hydrolase [Ardenticatenaceae bacterium]